MEYQLHSMQVGAADTLVGELVDHLRAMPTWADTLLIVTSDHGTNLSAPDIGRMKVTDANREEVYRVPLFIKVPGQVEGEIRDDSAQNLDVLPSVVDILGADVDWEFDGHSLYDGSAAQAIRRNQAARVEQLFGPPQIIVHDVVLEVGHLGGDRPERRTGARVRAPRSACATTRTASGGAGVRRRRERGERVGVAG